MELTRTHPERQAPFTGFSNFLKRSDTYRLLILEHRLFAGPARSTTGQFHTFVQYKIPVVADIGTLEFSSLRRLHLEQFR